MKDLIDIASKITVSKMISRDDFRCRIEAGPPVSLHEFLYPLMQAYDSVAIKADIELGGSNQLFNCMMGRDLQRNVSSRKQIVLTMPLLVGTDGVQKMSKSKGNSISLTDPAEVMYAQCMSIPDLCLETYLRLATSFKNPNLLLEKMKSGELQPMALKKMIAFDVVKTYHDQEQASLAENYFQRTVQDRKPSDSDYTPVSLSGLGVQKGINIVHLAHVLMPSQRTSLIRRLIRGGGVYLNGTRVKSLESYICFENAPLRLRIGKKYLFIFNA